jgi:hypothetical protein
MVVIDYITGILKAIYLGNLSSLAGWKGLIKKVCIFIVVAVAVQLEKAISNSSVKAVDLAANVGENSTVIQFSPLGEYLGHDKGLHRRKRVLT